MKTWDTAASELSGWEDVILLYCYQTLPSSVRQLHLKTWTCMSLSPSLSLSLSLSLSVCLYIHTLYNFLFKVITITAELSCLPWAYSDPINHVVSFLGGNWEWMGESHVRGGNASIGDWNIIGCDWFMLIWMNNNSYTYISPLGQVKIKFQTAWKHYLCVFSEAYFFMKLNI